MTLEDIGYRLCSLPADKETYEIYHRCRKIEFDHNNKNVRCFLDYQQRYQALKCTPEEIKAIYEMMVQMGWIDV